VYKTIVKRITRQTYASLSEGDYDAPLKKFTPETRFMFAGEYSLGCDLRGVDDVRAWFQRAFRLFPGLKFHVHDVVVGGGPWRTVVTSHFSTSATLKDGTPYSNEGMQYLVLKWGKVVEDLVFEDTQRMEAALQRLADAGEEEATANPIGTRPKAAA
jgi:ketosteroid isomerase-like protein